MITRLVPTPEVCSRTGRSRVTLHRWVKAGLFPPPKNVGPNGNGNAWLESDLEDYYNDPEGWVERNKAAA